MLRTIGQGDARLMTKLSDITSPGDSTGIPEPSEAMGCLEVVPDDYVQDGEAVETPVSEEVAQQRHLDQASDNRGRANLAAEVLREVADHIQAQGNITITPAVGGSVLGVLVAMMQESGWKKNAGLIAFSSVWGFEEGFDDGESETN